MSCRATFYCRQAPNVFARFALLMPLIFKPVIAALLLTDFRSTALNARAPGSELL